MTIQQFLSKSEDFKIEVLNHFHRDQLSSESVGFTIMMEYDYCLSDLNIREIFALIDHYCRFKPFEDRYYFYNGYNRLTTFDNLNDFLKTTYLKNPDFIKFLETESFND